MSNENNSIYLKAYNILSTALKEDKIDDGIIKSLNITKMYFDFDDVIIYKENQDVDYKKIFNQTMIINNNYPFITSIVNIAKNKIEEKKSYFMNIDLNSISNAFFIPIKVGINKYIITLTNPSSVIEVDDMFLDLFIETMTIILNKYEMINRLKQDAEIDILTGLKNRLAYEKIIIENKIYDEMVYGLLDLFRLKNINDTYSHLHGDEYIKRTAQILRKYFSNNIYRIGGDEFALISYFEKFENILIKIKIIQEEVRNIDLNINEILGINYGLVKRKDNETYIDLYKEADKLLSEDKTKTYKKLGIDRRK